MGETEEISDWKVQIKTWKLQKRFGDHRCLSRLEESKCMWTHGKDGAPCLRVHLLSWTRKTSVVVEMFQWSFHVFMSAFIRRYLHSFSKSFLFILLFLCENNNTLTLILFFIVNVQMFKFNYKYDYWSLELFSHYLPFDRLGYEPQSGQFSTWGFLPKIKLWGNLSQRISQKTLNQYDYLYRLSSFFGRYIKSTWSKIKVKSKKCP